VKDRKVAVIGGGAWGLALAKVLVENGNPVCVWEYNPQYVKILNETHTNPDLLSGIILPEAIRFTNQFSDLCVYAPEIIILAIPSQFIRSTLSGLSQETHNALFCRNDIYAIINVAKGVELKSGKLIHQLLNELLPCELPLFTLSGPSHAEEVARQLPTTVVIAGSEQAKLGELQRLFSNAYFRVYSSTDITGVEIGGAVKNIIAIASGILAGLGLGDNTNGALLSRGIVEIQRLGIALGAKAETFLGLSGIGDLITTATSPHSRNRFVGFEIGKGRKASDILASMKMVAEGVASTKAVYELSHRIGIEMPIVDQIYAILYQDKDPKAALNSLMQRELKPE